MPKASCKKAMQSSATKCRGRDQESEENVDSSPALQFQESELEMAISAGGDAKITPGQKRPFTIVSDENTETGNEMNIDFGSEMSKMLEMFGADINKSLLSKRKRIEQYTTAALKANQVKMNDMWETQAASRERYQEEFKRNVGTIFEQWELDLNKFKEQEEKLQKIIQQQLKLIQQARIVQTQRLGTLKQIHETFLKGLEELETKHHAQQNTVQTELKKEMGLLQKKMLIETQQQEMQNVRKSLHTMLFS